MRHLTHILGGYVWPVSLLSLLLPHKTSSWSDVSAVDQVWDRVLPLLLHQWAIVLSNWILLAVPVLWSRCSLYTGCQLSESSLTEYTHTQQVTWSGLITIRWAARDSTSLGCIAAGPRGCRELPRANRILCLSSSLVLHHSWETSEASILDFISWQHMTCCTKVLKDILFLGRTGTEPGLLWPVPLSSKDVAFLAHSIYFGLYPWHC